MTPSTTGNTIVRSFSIESVVTGAADVGLTSVVAMGGANAATINQQHIRTLQ